MKALIALGINVLIVAAGVALYMWYAERRRMSAPATTTPAG